MPVPITCPSCGVAFNLADKMSGKKVRCKVCQDTFVVPGKPEIEDTLPVEEPPERAVEGRLQSQPRSSKERPAAMNQASLGRPKSLKIQRGFSTVTVLLIAGGAAVFGALLLGVGAAWYFARPVPPAAEPVAVGPAPQVPAAAPEAANPQAQGAAPEAAKPQAPAAQPQDPEPPAPPPVKADKPAAVRPIPLAPDVPALRYRWLGDPHVYHVRIESERSKTRQIYETNCVLQAKPIDRPPERVTWPWENRSWRATGFVVNPDGYIITCDYKIGDGGPIEVVLGEDTYPATVVDIDSDHQLALLKIEAQNLPALPLADSEKAEVGLEVRAFGYSLPTALGEHLSATRGTLGRISTRNGRKVLHFDASLKPGQGGGPVVTEGGAVVGVSYAILKTEVVTDVCVAAPSQAVQRLLRNNGVAFTQANPQEKLDGPTLVKRVSPAVVHVHIDPSAAGATAAYALTCRSIPIPRQLDNPAAGVRDLGSRTSEIEMDSLGRILKTKTRNYLPDLLGELGDLFINRLSPDTRKTWERSQIWTLVRKGSDANAPFWPAGEDKTPTRIIGRQRTFYTREPAVGKEVTIQKRWDWTASDGEGYVVSVTGKGSVTFDFPSGLPVVSTCKLNVTAGSLQKVVTVHCKLLEGKERDLVLKPLAPQNKDQDPKEKAVAKVPEQPPRNPMPPMPEPQNRNPVAQMPQQQPRNPQTQVPNQQSGNSVAKNPNQQPGNPFPQMPNQQPRNPLAKTPEPQNRNPFPQMPNRNPFPPMPNQQNRNPFPQGPGQQNRNPFPPMPNQQPRIDTVGKNGETKVMGGGHMTFRDEAPEDGMLIGFEVGVGQIFGGVMCAVRPIYRTAKGEEVQGKQYGTNLKQVTTIKAKPGFAVGTITAKAGLLLDGFRVTFMRVTDTGLDPNDSYQSEWIGGKGGGQETQLGTPGTPVTGIIAKTNGNDCCGMGLLLKQK